MRLSNGPASPEFVEMPRHAKYPPAGTKQQMRSSSLWLDQADAQVRQLAPHVCVCGALCAGIVRCERCTACCVLRQGAALCPLV